MTGHCSAVVDAGANRLTVLAPYLWFSCNNKIKFALLKCAIIIEARLASYTLWLPGVPLSQLLIWAKPTTKRENALCFQQLEIILWIKPMQSFM